jgi:hypothetical protein
VGRTRARGTKPVSALAEQARPRTAAGLACPFLRAVRNEPDLTYPHGLGCELRRGATRAPSADELAWFCTNGHHHSCATYRRRRETEEVS